jgi:1-aminocyclopropane-1-carboxylate deaminase
MNNPYLNVAASVEQEIVSEEIWIKRDDLIHPVVSGNKWRKLKYIIEDIKAKGLSKVVTFGGAFSNHILATSCVCAQEALDCHIVIRGEKPKNLNHYLLMCKSFGAHLHFVSRHLYKDKQASLDSLVGLTDTYIINEGGEHPLAFKGCEEIVDELKQNYDFIFTASGTGTTAIGLAEAIRKRGLKTRLIVVPVLKNEDEISEKLRNYNAEVLKDRHCGGYAKTNDMVFESIEEMLRNHGILLDPIYTAKSYMAMIDYLEGQVSKKSLFLHTGGIMGLFSEAMLNKWQKSQLVHLD